MKKIKGLNNAVEGYLDWKRYELMQEIPKVVEYIKNSFPKAEVWIEYYSMDNCIWINFIPNEDNDKKEFRLYRLFKDIFGNTPLILWEVKKGDD